MTAKQLRMCLAIAKDYSIDLSRFDDSALFGFGCPDFEPVTVSAGAVARCMRWQSSRFDGGWDEAQFSADRPFYLKNVELSDVTQDEAREVIVECMSRVLVG